MLTSGTLSPFDGAQENRNPFGDVFGRVCLVLQRGVEKRSVRDESNAGAGWKARTRKEWKRTWKNGGWGERGRGSREGEESLEGSFGARLVSTFS